MANNTFDFNVEFKKILHLLDTLKSEGIEIVPALRNNEFYKPGYHGREKRVYNQHFLCLTLIHSELVTICYLERAEFGPNLDRLFRIGETEDVSKNMVQILDAEDFKKRLGFEYFIPSKPVSSDPWTRDKIAMRNNIFFAISTLDNIPRHRKLVEIYNGGEQK